MLEERRLRLVICLGLIVLAGGVSVLAVFRDSFGVRIIDASPAGGSDDVPITAAFRLAFSQPMDVASVEERLRIEPVVTGRWVWESETLAFQPLGGLVPGTAYTVTLEGGATAQNGSILQEERTWRFRTRAPQLLFMGRPYPGAELRQLFVVPYHGAEPQQLTEHQWGVWDYAVHPQGEEVVYSVLRGDGGSDLWRMDRTGADQHLLLACPEAACLAPSWSSDGRLLAYEQRSIAPDGPNLDPKAARVWLIDFGRNSERPLFDYDVPLHSPRWAPSGEILAYVSPMLPGVEVYDLRTEELQQFGNEWGAAPVWSPDATHLVVPELILAGEALVVRLFRVDPGEGQAVDISGGGDEDGFRVRDEAPAWSPRGDWIAFGRRFLDEDRWTPGRQIWLTRPDSSDSHALLTEPMADHFAFAWRPDGAALAYVRADLSEGPQPVPDVSVFFYDFSTGESVFVAADGVLPTWLP